MVAQVGIVTVCSLLLADPGSEWLRLELLDAADQELIALLPAKRFSVPIFGIPKTKKLKLSYFSHLYFYFYQRGFMRFSASTPILSTAFLKFYGVQTN